MGGVHRTDDDGWASPEPHFTYLTNGPPRNDGRWAPVLTVLAIGALVVFLYVRGPVGWVAISVFAVVLATRLRLAIRTPPDGT